MYNISKFFFYTIVCKHFILFVWVCVCLCVCTCFSIQVVDLNLNTHILMGTRVPVGT